MADLKAATAQEQPPRWYLTFLQQLHALYRLLRCMPLPYSICGSACNWGIISCRRRCKVGVLGQCNPLTSVQDLPHIPCGTPCTVATFVYGLISEASLLLDGIQDEEEGEEQTLLSHITVMLEECGITAEEGTVVCFLPCFWSTWPKFRPAFV